MKSAWIIVAAAALAALAGDATALAQPRTPVIRGVVWADTDRDGVRDPGEAGVRGARVVLQRRVGGRWRAVRRVDATAGGRYRHRLTARGAYRIVVSRPSGYEAFAPRRRPRGDSDVDTHGRSSIRARRSATIDAGLLPAAATRPSDPVPPAAVLALPGGTVRGSVWRETTVDGRREPGEPASPTAVVQLWSGDRSALLATATTGADGTYGLMLPSRGTPYRVRVVLPGGAVAYSPYDAVTGDADDSDVREGGADAGFSDLRVADGGRATIDAGLRFAPAVTISGRAFRDALNDGIEDPAGLDAAIEIWDGERTALLAATTASASGPVPGGWSATLPYGGIAIRVQMRATTDSLVGRQGTTPDRSVDSDLVQYGADDGWTPPLALPVTGAPMTDIDGAFVSATPIGNRVWLDADEDGIQDAGEPGIAGVHVEAWDATRTRLLARSVSNASGIYGVAVRGGGLTYALRFTAPAGHRFTVADAGRDTHDSDPAGDGWVSVPLASTVIAATTTYDAGLVPAP